MIENITMGQLGVGVAFIVALVKGIDYLFDLITKPHNKIVEKHDEDIKALRAEIEKKANADVIKEIQKDIKIILQMELANTEHNLYGNHVEEMQNKYAQLKEHLIND